MTATRLVLREASTLHIVLAACPLAGLWTMTSVASDREIFVNRGPWIESSHGYRVRILGRAGMEYQDQAGSLRLDVESLADSGFVLYETRVPEDPTRPRRTIVDNVRRALEANGWNLEVVT